MKEFPVAVIGGSGLYSMEGLDILGKRDLHTPFGTPSSALLLASYRGRGVIFLPRHGEGHQFNPTRVNYRANIYALKTMGVRYVISVSAVGSLREEYAPRHFVLPDQLIDRTRNRPDTFYDELAVHVGFADPFCPRLRKIIAGAAEGTGITLHEGGTYVCMEGPLFSTRAESELYRSWGASLIGMTALPEAKLAREAEMCYATIAMVTDYDVWKDEEVSVEQVMANVAANTANVKALLKRVIEELDAEAACSCHEALKNTIMTRPEYVDEETRRKLAPLLGKYLEKH